MQETRRGRRQREPHGIWRALNPGGLLIAYEKTPALGAIILPPVPAFYARPQTLDEAVTQIAARAIELAGVDPDHALVRWSGSSPSKA